MTDQLTPEKRSWNMSRIRSGDTRPEIMVRKVLHAMGYRFRIHRRDLPGKPDIVLPRHRTVVFVHGCFWHRHTGCSKAYTPKSRVDFWQQKFSQNVERDARNTQELKALGWRVVVIWECEVSSAEETRERLKTLLCERHF